MAQEFTPKKSDLEAEGYRVIMQLLALEERLKAIQSALQTYE